MTQIPAANDRLQQRDDTGSGEECTDQLRLAHVVLVHADGAGEQEWYGECGEKHRQVVLQGQKSTVSVAKNIDK